MKYPAIMRAFDGSVWAITYEKMAQIRDFLASSAEGVKVGPDQIEILARDRVSPGQPVAEGVAVIPVEGVIVQKAGMIEKASGMVSTEEIGRAFDAAVSSPQVRAIILAFDSPGGSVPGVPELAAKVFAARGSKPLYAVANSMACSAAYWIASACDEVIVQPSGEVGSIGALMIHSHLVDGTDEKGRKYEILSAGRYKAELNPVEPLSESGREFVRGRLDAVYSEFVRDVAKHRGVGADAVIGGYGEGRSLRGEESVRAKLADRTGTLDQVIRETLNSMKRKDSFRAERDYWNS